MRLGDDGRRRARRSRALAASRARKHINPQYAPDGRALYFVVRPGRLQRRLPARRSASGARVARDARRHRRQRHHRPVAGDVRRARDAAHAVLRRSTTRLLGVAAWRRRATVGHAGACRARRSSLRRILPPATRRAARIISNYLRRLRAPACRQRTWPSSSSRIARSSRWTRWASRPWAWAPAAFGTQVSGGGSLLFGDQLGNQQIFGAVQAQGQLQDIGGAVLPEHEEPRELGRGRVAHPVSHGLRATSQPGPQNGGLYSTTSTSSGSSWTR